MIKSSSGKMGSVESGYSLLQKMLKKKEGRAVAHVR